MSVSALEAAKYLGLLSGWSKTNLELHKILYIAHMLHLGMHDKPLVDGNFQAWLFGPVYPSLYSKLEVFGAKPVKNIFRTIDDLDEDGTEAEILNLTYNFVSDFSAARLIAITHCSYGAWSKNYQSGVFGILISSRDILLEYKARQARAAGETGGAVCGRN